MLINISFILFQITSMNFIKRLTEEYGEYTDLVQPIQVAVYEMKLGLAISLSGYLQREYLKKIKEDTIERVMVCMVLQLIGELCIVLPRTSINISYLLSCALSMVKKVAADIDGVLLQIQFMLSIDSW